MFDVTRTGMKSDAATNASLADPSVCMCFHVMSYVCPSDAHKRLGKLCKDSTWRKNYWYWCVSNLWAMIHPSPGLDIISI